MRALLMLGRYFTRGLAGEVDPVRAREALIRARAGGVAEAETELAVLPFGALDEETLDETGPPAPEEPVVLELADLESASESELGGVAEANKFESAAEALGRPVSAASAPYISLVPPHD